MRVFRGFTKLPDAWRGSIAAIGNFDGVHLGHRAVLSAAKNIAADKGAQLGLITFEPHPRDIIRPEIKTPRLSSVRRKVELAREIGVDQLMVLPFSKYLMAKPAEEFIQDVLLDQFGLGGVACGTNFRFGHKRSGTFDLLRVHAERSGVVAVPVAPHIIDGEPCSSSRIRQALSDGRIDTANRLLGYDYEITGVVRQGEKRGRELGFPTANTYPLPAGTAMPSTGIYTVSARPFHAGIEGNLPAVASLGRNPTFDGIEERLEVHILDRQGLDLYGQRLKIAFHERLRGEERYDSIDALVAQIEKDCDQARRTHELLKHQRQPPASFGSP